MSHFYTYSATKNSQHNTVNFFIHKPDESPLTGLIYNAAGLVCWFIAPHQQPVQVPLVNIADPASPIHVSNGFAEINATNTPGWYRFDIHNSIFEDYDTPVHMEFKGAANMERTVITLDILPVPVYAWRVNVSAAYDHILKRIRLLAWLDLTEALYENALAATFNLYQESVAQPIAAVTNSTPDKKFFASIDNIDLNPDNVYFLECLITDAEGASHKGAVGISTLD